MSRATASRSLATELWGALARGFLHIATRQGSVLHVAKAGAYHRREWSPRVKRVCENRKFIQAPSPEIWSETISGCEEVLAGKWGGLFLGYLLGKNIFRCGAANSPLPPSQTAAQRNASGPRPQSGWCQVASRCDEHPIALPLHDNERRAVH